MRPLSICSGLPSLWLHPIGNCLSETEKCCWMNGGKSGYEKLLQNVGWEEGQRTYRQLSLPEKAARLLQLAKPEHDWNIEHPVQIRRWQVEADRRASARNHSLQVWNRQLTPRLRC